jgi:hypothetical protein
VLAMVVLRERVSRCQGFGMVMAMGFSYVKPLPVGKAVDGFVHRFGDG